MQRAMAKKGFTLIEVMIAAGILAIGFVMIAGAFPVGVKLTAVSTERTISSVAANEAFSTIQLKGLAPLNLHYGQTIAYPFDSPEDLYPSTGTDNFEKLYNVSALIKGVEGDFSMGPPKATKALVTVFVCRTSQVKQLEFPDPAKLMADPSATDTIDRPEPIRVKREDLPAPPGGGVIIDNRITVHSDNAVLAKYIMQGSVLLDEKSGKVLTVKKTEYRDTSEDYKRLLRLTKDYDEAEFGDYFWVIPQAVKFQGPELVPLGINPFVMLFQRQIEVK